MSLSEVVKSNHIMEMLEFNGITNAVKVFGGVKVGNLLLKTTSEAKTWIDVVNGD